MSPTPFHPRHSRCNHIISPTLLVLFLIIRLATTRLSYMITVTGTLHRSVLCCCGVVGDPRVEPDRAQFDSMTREAKCLRCESWRVGVLAHLDY